MTLVEILIIALGALALRLVFPGHLRKWGLLAASILAIYWLQPLLPIRNMDFWFPTATLGVILLSWALVADKTQLTFRENIYAILIMVGFVLLIAMTRFISLKGLITPSRPPQFSQVVIALLFLLGLGSLLIYIVKPTPMAIGSGIFGLLALFIVLKTPALASATSLGLRQIMAQDTSLAKFTDLGWLGFSYVAFRLIHTMIDRINGQLKDIQLGEYMVYVLFFPAFIAGPLDRLQHFRQDLENPHPLEAGELLQSGKRLAIGLFRKFILADSLALIALSGGNIQQVIHTGWLWVMLIAYALQIYFDFAGYTDIAIASGILLGFKLPENFNQPYRKPNLTLFWNNWHMSLTQWFRAYFFFPLTRKLRKANKLSAPLIIFSTQMSTMLLIGLWHGVTPNFLIWGAWHGLGLFFHNRWRAMVSPKLAKVTQQKPVLDDAFQIIGIILTFLFVSLGWVWFRMPTFDLAATTFAKLF